MYKLHSSSVVVVFLDVNATDFVQVGNWKKG